MDAFHTTHPDMMPGYPRRSVVGVVDDPLRADAALQSLLAAGTAVDDVEVLTGTAGLHRLDPDGREHGLRGWLYRLSQGLGDWEHEIFHRLGGELRAGHTILAIHHRGAHERLRAERVLHARQAHACFNFWLWSNEQLAA